MDAQGLVFYLQRRKLGLTQQQVADRAGTTHATVAHVEKGVRQPSLDMRDRLDAALALGDRQGADRPLYVLATPDARGEWTPLGADVDPDGAEQRVVAFQNRALAERTVGLLAYLLPQLGVSPVWPTWLAAQRHEPLLIDYGSRAETVEHLAAWVADFAHQARTGRPRRLYGGDPPTFAPDVPVPEHQTTNDEVPA